MHPLRPKKLVLRAGLVDRLADWLLEHCPFTTLTTLTLVVAGSSIGTSLPRPALVMIPVIVADLSLNLYRYVRDLRRGAAAAPRRSGSHARVIA